MAKNKVYIDKNHPDRGFYYSWADCEIAKRGGGTNFYGYPTEAEAHAALAALIAPREEDSWAHLSAVTGLGDVSGQTKQVNALLDRVEAVDPQAVIALADYPSLAQKYDCELTGAPYFPEHEDADAVAFVDGGGNKVGARLVSTALPFGVVLFEKGKIGSTLYRLSLTKGDDGVPDWLFRASNATAEQLAALCVMRLCERQSIGSVVIYQDNTLPARYFDGSYKKIHHTDDYGLMIFIRESMRYLEGGLRIAFRYVPSEHSTGKSAAKKQAAFASQPGSLVPFATAQFYNAVADLLADYRFG